MRDERVASGGDDGDFGFEGVRDAICVARFDVRRAAVFCVVQIEFRDRPTFAKIGSAFLRVRRASSSSNSSRGTSNANVVERSKASEKS